MNVAIHTTQVFVCHQLKPEEILEFLKNFKQKTFFQQSAIISRVLYFADMKFQLLVNRSQ